MCDVVCRIKLQNGMQGTRIARQGRRNFLHDERDPFNPTRRRTMFKIIGATVVYGFALLGLCTYLSSVGDSREQ